MTATPRGKADAALAGGMLVGAMLGCAAAGHGLGSLAGLAVPLGRAGLFVGLVATIAHPSVAGRVLAPRTTRPPGSLVAGFFLVHARYRRI